jgi:hypothetical protein
MPVDSPTRFVMVPARRSDEPTARKRARRILVALFVAAGLSVVATVLSLGKGHGSSTVSSADPRGRDVAYTAAVNYLAGSYQNVPHVSSLNPDDLAVAASGTTASTPSTPLPYQSLSWVGFTPEHFGSDKTGYTDFEVHHFLVVLDQGKTSPPPSQTDAAPDATAQPTPGDTAAPTLTAGTTPSDGATPGDDSTPSVADGVVQLDVSILITPQGPRLAAAPSLASWTGGLGGATGTGDYTNYADLAADVSDAVKNQVGAWARAYVTGDSAGLLTVTGDQNGAHRYVGLHGFTLPNTADAVQILSVIKVAQGQLVARVRVLLAKSLTGGTVSTGGGNAQQFTTFADFDLLVGSPNGAQPPILAWGPAGSAAELEPYCNALNS